MPNWCMNSLSISTGTDGEGREALQALIEAATNEHDDQRQFLQHMHPMPEELNDTTAPSDGPNWYWWRVNEWGTKWEVDVDLDIVVDDEDGHLEVLCNFSSAWSPPVDALKHFSELNPDLFLSLSYWEPGMAFVGEWTSDGVDEHYEYSTYNSKNIREHIPERIIDDWDLQYELEQWEELEEEEAH